MPAFTEWLFKVEDHLATLMLNRAAKRNTLTPEALFELRAAAEYIKNEADIWAVIVEGAGEHFSVGVDVNVISGIIGQDLEVFRQNLGELQACLDAFEALPKPTIAKIRGYCVGGGLILALCCDFRLAAAEATFIVPEVKRGIAVLMGTQRITRTVGLPRAKELTMLGDPISAAQAYEYGMLTQVVPNADLDAAVEQFAAKFRQLPPLTVSICKQIADQGQTLTLRQSQALELELQSGLLHTEDLQEAISSFFEKRPSVFKGR